MLSFFYISLFFFIHVLKMRHKFHIYPNQQSMDIMNWYKSHVFSVCVLWHEGGEKNITIIFKDYLNIFLHIKTRTDLYLFNICRNVHRVTEGNKNINYMLIWERGSCMIAENWKANFFNDSHKSTKNHKVYNFIGSNIYDWNIFFFAACMRGHNEQQGINMPRAKELIKLKKVFF